VKVRQFKSFLKHFLIHHSRGSLRKPCAFTSPNNPQQTYFHHKHKQFIPPSHRIKQVAHIQAKGTQNNSRHNCAHARLGDTDDFSAADDPLQPPSSENRRCCKATRGSRGPLTTVGGLRLPKQHRRMSGLVNIDGKSLADNHRCYPVNSNNWVAAMIFRRRTFHSNHRLPKIVGVATQQEGRAGRGQLRVVPLVAKATPTNVRSRQHGWQTNRGQSSLLPGELEQLGSSDDFSASGRSTPTIVFRKSSVLQGNKRVPRAMDNCGRASGCQSNTDKQGRTGCSVPTFCHRLAEAAIQLKTAFGQASLRRA